MEWWKSLKGRLRFNEPLSRYTSFKIGGRSSVFFEPTDTGDLSSCLRQIKKLKIPYLLIGNGTNLLLNDSGFKGVVIRLSSQFFKGISIRNNILTVGPGVNLKDMVNYLSNNGFSGYEFLAGIPGSIAGALVMNAGATVKNKRFSIGDITHMVKVLDKNSKILDLSWRKCEFRYRKSNLDKYIIIQAQLKMTKSEGSISSNNRIKEFLLYRSKHQDYAKPNAGCIFKNPSQLVSAGKLIEECGLKGLRCGGAEISNKHANFILNFNHAKASDVIKLINIAKKRVKDKFGIALKEEIKIVS